MAIRIIRTDKDPVLRKKSKPVDKIDRKTDILIKDMLDTMYEAQGVGLAAPQVGILKRIIVIDIGDTKKPYIVINPEMVLESGNQYEIEGCLSVPGLRGKVNRPMEVVVKGLDEKGKAVEYKASGFLAKAFCHEIDHLEGILYTDKADMVDDDEIEE